MESKKSDIRTELEGMITEIQEKIGSLRGERDRIDKTLQDAESALGALRTVYQMQAERFGETKPSLFAKGGKSYRFANMKLIEALELLREENPRIDKKEAHRILVKEGFDFRTKRTLSAVHFAWIALERRKTKK